MGHGRTRIQKHEMTDFFSSVAVLLNARQRQMEKMSIAKSVKMFSMEFVIQTSKFVLHLFAFSCVQVSSLMILSKPLTTYKTAISGDACGQEALLTVPVL